MLCWVSPQRIVDEVLSTFFFGLVVVHLPDFLSFVACEETEELGKGSTYNLA